MAQVYRNVSNSEVRDVLYERPDRLLDNYHRSLFEEGGLADRFTTRFKERSLSKIKQLKQSRAVRAAQGAFRKIRTRGRLDHISELKDIASMQHAALRMQRFVMSNPRARRLWQEESMAGYENGYNKTATERTSFKHSDRTYRMIMNERVHEDDGEARAHNYALCEEDREELTQANIADILLSWEKVEQVIWEGVDDPTSEYNAML